MIIKCSVRAVLAVATMTLMPALGFAQNATNPPPQVPLQKTIGRGKPDIVPAMIVMNARGAAIKDGPEVRDAVVVLKAPHPEGELGKAAVVAEDASVTRPIAGVLVWVSTYFAYR